ncbi:DDE-type integrase/transposase/recombinase [Rhodococcoides fascians A25f]|nr:DDE-type integrase/transposase/recombinase [Rhodococcus fascians A25f]
MAVADHVRAELVLDTLHMAVADRGGDVAGTIAHSDSGRQHAAALTKKACEQYGLRRSMGKIGIRWDNAGAESLWSTFKHDFYIRHAFVFRSKLIAVVRHWMYFHNKLRRFHRPLHLADRQSGHGAEQNARNAQRRHIFVAPRRGTAAFHHCRVHQALIGVRNIR